MHSNLRGFTFAVLIGFFLSISCNKDTVNPPSWQSTTHEYSLAGQTWLMYQYSDSTDTNIIPASDTLRFLDSMSLTWADSIATYELWKDSRYGQGLNFHHTPYGTFGSNYISNAAFDTDSIQFVIRFYGYQAKYCWFRRL